jgi:hypothetical protein
MKIVSLFQSITSQQQFTVFVEPPFSIKPTVCELKPLPRQPLQTSLL